jgi:dihydrofolate reductase
VIALIAARSRNAVIGCDGRLPWRLPEDLKRFRAITVDHTVVMGRRTFESLPPTLQPLPQRRNIVISSQAGYGAGRAEVVPSLDAALVAAERDCFVIGGEQVFRDAMPMAEKAYITDVDMECAGDAFFPPLSEEDWSLTSETPAISDGGYRVLFRVYERRV